MLGYHVWANRRVFAHLKSLPPEVTYKEVPSVFPSIAHTLVHMYVVDTLWLQAMTGQSFHETRASIPRLVAEIDGKSVAEMEELFAALAGRYEAFLRSQEDPDRELVIEHPHYGRLHTRLSDLVQHVVNHGTYHRGNITAMLRQLGHPGVQTDYVLYLYALSRDHEEAS
ncbi:MAG: damage-inducible protein DinB [Bacillota bacterium]|nr:MAG: damage-inducible protein DinB [Bacillota bacterium]